MATDYDVAVLGGGIAGSAAALAAAQSGARVCVLAGPPGATAMFSGAWRGPCPAELRAALDRTGYELRAVSAALPHPAGALVPADLAATSHAFTRIQEALVVGVAGLPGFNAHVLAAQWHARGATVVRLDATPAAGWAPASLAACIARDPGTFAALLKTHSRGVSHVVLPAVLGLQHDGALHAAIERVAGCTISEALGVPPSLPGWRLYNALQQALTAAGVTTLAHKVIGAQHADRVCSSVSLVNGDVVRAKSFVLATGKYASGGITSNGAFHEPVFDCPVWVEHLGEIFEEADSLNLTDAVRSEDQPLLKAGVHVDERNRPVNRGGDVVYDNVMAAGSIRAGWSADTHGAGDAATDGWHAGREAVRA